MGLAMTNRIGRNDPCACGSGKKYKQCCLAKDQAASTAAQRTASESPALLSAAIQHHQAGRLSEAETLYRQILDADPSHADALNLLGVLAHQSGHDDAAVELIGRALRERPQMAIYHNNMALVLQSQRRYDTALEHYQTALAIHPDFAEAHNNIGNVYRDQGHLDKAAGHYRKAIELQPEYAEAHYNLGIAMQQQGNLTEAIRHYRRAVALRRDYLKAWNNLGNALLEQGDNQGAADCYRTTLSLKPDFADAYVNLGGILLNQGDAAAAIEMLRKALTLAPTDHEALSNIGGAYQMLGKLELAIDYCRRAIALDPDHAATHSNLAGSLQLLGELDEARRAYERALELEPGLADAHAGLASLYIDLGQFDAAQREIDLTLALSPQHPGAWATIPLMRKMTAEDTDWLATALALRAPGAPPLPARAAIKLGYALGKYYDDTKQYELAFEAYRQANAIKRKAEGVFDRAGFTRLVDAMIDRYPSALVNRSRAGANPSDRPVLVVGMPRSGTSLTEQIIASHPQAFGAGELIELGKQIYARRDAVLAGTLDDAALTQLAAGYERRLQALATDAARIVDKMPNNFLWLGPFHMALPNARIVHVRRNPVDTCLSVHFQNFNITYSYATDLDDLAYYYREYRRLMAHWRTVLPPDRFLEIDYETLIENQERESRKILDFLGLPWDENCLDFHQTERKVGTASNWQVRQKIYKTSKERWRNYETHVGPLLALLTPP